MTTVTPAAWQLERRRPRVVIIGGFGGLYARVMVSPDLSVPGHPEVFVIGDLAAISSNGKAVTAVAPAAIQMGRPAARNIRRTLEQRERVPFACRNKGDLATIGRHRAIADFGRLQVTGSLAWWFWLLLHILYPSGFRNRLSALFEVGGQYRRNM